MSYLAPASFFATLLSIAALSFAGCAAPLSDEADATAESYDELSVSNLTELSISRSVGFRPPPPVGGCWPSGGWTVDFTTDHVEGQGCADGRPIAVDRALTTGELAAIRAAVAKVRTISRPAACPTDMPVTSLQVTRGAKKTAYVEQIASCGSAAKPITRASVDPLVALMQSLTAPAVAAPANASTCNGTPCFAVKGSCFDVYGKAAPLESFENVSFGYVPGEPLTQIAWLADDTQAPSRATARFRAWLRNYQSVFLDGTARGMTTYWEGARVNVFVEGEVRDSAVELTMTSNGGSYCKLSARLL